ncbi:MAG: nicotinate (nicotinamide) nucleotide adenylyltransferase [Eubacteriales bacterium]|nr:nicotinate (nicotinamide) nucleotide adenylyltransferase [Eubacteriales bacterium]
MRVKKAIFGGTFDPFHLGHLAILKSALEHGDFAEILIVPVGQPPLKGRRPLPASFREQIIELSIGDLERVSLSDLELAKPQEISYTVDSLNLLKALEPEVDWSLIYGSDVLFSIENWHQPEEIAKLAKFYVAHRAGEEIEAALAKAEELRLNLGANIEFFPLSGIELSSTVIREQLAQAKKPNTLAPEAQKFCQDWALYQYDEAWQQISSEAYVNLALLELFLAENLSQARLFHSLSVMLYGLELCRIHGLDAERFAVAAILHDLAKEWPLERQGSWAEKYAAQAQINAFNLHGLAAAAYANLELGITDREIIEAIALHSSAGVECSNLARLLFLADTLEPHRSYSDHQELMELAAKDLDLAYLKTLESKAEYMERKGFFDSAELLNGIKEAWAARLAGK